MLTGPIKKDASFTYLWPEAAQGIFVNFENVEQSKRKLSFEIGRPDGVRETRA
jgi:glycyl-tRNA synthetase (class II)